MKLFSLIAIALLLASCSEPEPKIVGKVNGVEYTEWDDFYTAKLSSLKSPVILIGKNETLGCWGITVQDANGEIVSIGNLVPTANNIGASRMIGDTIK